MAEQWVEQMQNQVNTLEKLETYINVTEEERHAIESLDTKWGVTPYFASLMDKDDPACLICIDSAFINVGILRFSTCC